MFSTQPLTGGFKGQWELVTTEPAVPFNEDFSALLEASPFATFFKNYAREIEKEKRVPVMTLGYDDRAALQEQTLNAIIIEMVKHNRYSVDIKNLGEEHKTRLQDLSQRGFLVMNDTKDQFMLSKQTVMSKLFQMKFFQGRDVEYFMHPTA